MSPRNKRFRRVGSPPVLKGFKPIGLPYTEAKPVTVLFEEYEALRLIDYSKLKQDEAAEIMKVSRPTFTRIYNSCLNKLAKAFAEGRTIMIEGGHVEFDKEWYRCRDCTTVFCHPDEGHNECINCKSGNIEHINKTLMEWGESQARPQEKADGGDYCICTSCQYEVPHQRGVPCFSLTCPECNIPLIRKGFK